MIGRWLVWLAMLPLLSLIGVLARPAPADASVDQPIVVVFVEGLNSSSTDDGAVFKYLWDAIRTLQPGAQRSVYSYTGGRLDADTGLWSPNPYAACDTQQTLAQSEAALDTTISALRGRWPDAKLAVVGHSLGGYLAMTWLADSVAAGADPVTWPAVVIAVDSPLHGLAPEQVAFAASTDPSATCLPAAQLELVRYRQAGRDASLVAGLGRAIEAQRLIVTVGNESDVAYACCGGPRIYETQFLNLPGAIEWRFPEMQPDLPGLAPGPLASHHAALFNNGAVYLMAGAIVSD